GHAGSYRRGMTTARAQTITPRSRGGGVGQPNPPPLPRNRHFLILWAGQAVSALGTSMSVLVFPLVGFAITGSTLLAGLATTAVLLGSVVARLPAGALADRWPRG